MTDRSDPATGAPERFAWVPIGAFAVVAAIFVALRLAGMYPWTDPIFDMFAYWTTRFGLDYSSAVPGQTGVYIYSPAFAHAIALMAALPWPAFAALWTALLGVALWWLGGRWALPLALVPPVALSVGIGQVDVLMAAAVVLGFRWPAAWAFPILTKVTPGIGLLWFAVRREWRSLAIAAAATAAIAGLSAMVDPAAWRGWLAMLLRLDFPDSPILTYLPVPVWLRLPLVAALIVWGARTNRRWTLPIATCLALPTVWLNSPAILIAVLPLLAVGTDTPAAAWLRSPDAGPGVVRRRLVDGLVGARAAIDRGFYAAGVELVRAWRAARWSALRWVAAVRRRAGVERRLSRRASGVDR